MLSDKAMKSACGKSIKEALKAVTDETVYIGSGSGFLYIGTKEGFCEKVDSLNEKYLSYFKRSLVEAEKQLNSFRDLTLSREPDEEIDTFAIRLINMGKKIESVQHKQKKIETYLKNWKNIESRKVKEVYAKDPILDENGVVILVDGLESGDYWMKEEVKK